MVITNTSLIDLTHELLWPTDLTQFSIILIESIGLCTVPATNSDKMTEGVDVGKQHQTTSTITTNGNYKLILSLVR
jgi:hypothetical protein